MILYVHGFGGSPEGSTVQSVRKYMNDIQVLGLSYDARDPDLAIKKLTEQYFHCMRQTGSDGDSDEILLMGSSLGGFYAAHVAAEVGCKLVLFNPALNPVESLGKYSGETIETPRGQQEFQAEHVMKYEKFCGQAMLQTFDKIVARGFGILLFTTEDPIISNQMAIDICKGNSHHIHFADVNEHRLSDRSVKRIRQSIEGYYRALWY